MTSDWQRELDVITDLMKEVSRQSDPQSMVRLYGAGIRRLLPMDKWMSLSRRGLQAPATMVTRYSGWEEEVNPWEARDTLPVVRGGLLSELLHAGEPRVIQDLRVSPDDPGREFLEGMRGLITLPQYDDGVAQNMTLLMWKDPSKIPLDRYPNMVWQSNLFGRATLNLVLRRELAKAYEALDREMRAVGEMQQSLLPRALPRIEGMGMAAYYSTSRRAGGDYYDAFALPGGRWGICIADVSGHGTPAAVMMAVTHAIAHNLPGPPQPPSELLSQLNRRLHAHYTADGGSFVTAFYGMYDPNTRRLEYASAGHNPPRLCTGSGVVALDAVGGLPLGIDPEHVFEESEITLKPGDRLVLYTDGITEARAPGGELFGESRLDGVLCRGHATADEFVSALVANVDEFCAGRAQEDDRTLLACWLDGGVTDRPGPGAGGRR